MRYDILIKKIENLSMPVFDWADARFNQGLQAAVDVLVCAELDENEQCYQDFKNEMANHQRFVEQLDGEEQEYDLALEDYEEAESFYGEEECE